VAAAKRRASTVVQCVRPAIAAAVLFASSIAWSATSADSLAVVDALPPGRYAVGCSNVEQDFSRVRAGETAENYWEGFPDGSRDRYVTQLFTDPADALTIGVNVPDDRQLFVNHARQQVATALLVCYPTTADNPRAAYPLPTGDAVPHMQRGADAPLWFDSGARWPLLFSHGLSGSPLSNDYVVALTMLASYGYVVVAPFHGDPRFADIKIDNLSDALYAVLHFPTYVEMQAIRPLSTAAALDFLLGHPQYRDHVDAARIAGFGASLGGETLLLQAGAKLTATIGLSSKQVIADNRLKAIVGYVPYFGQSFLPAFGRDQNGLDSVTTPFLGIGGFADTTAPIGTIAQGVRRLPGSRELVGLEGVGHYFDFPSAPDIFTWSMTFFAAHAQDDRVARAKVARMTSVRGGGDDRLIIDYTEPATLDSEQRNTVEYFNASLRHYFMTADQAQIALLDAGIVVPGWARTGFEFKSWTLESGVGVPACRFFGTPGIGPNTHFFSGLAFGEQAPIGEDCPVGLVPVTRLYNNGMGGQANHRFLTSHSEAQAMVDAGWLIEGIVFCAAP
jgi:predicted dienelactone hydrolase